MNKIIKFIKRDKVQRALITFIEAFFSYLALNALNIDNVGIKYLLIGAFGSAFSILINSFRNSDEITKDDFEGDDF